MLKRSQSYIFGGMAALALLIGGNQTSFSQENIAPLGNGILGYATTDDGSLGTPYEHAGATGNVNDGDLTTRSDTWGGAVTDVPYDYVGVIWPSASPTEFDTVRLTMATFFDGGWFGSGGAGAGRALTVSDGLPEPKLQITFDGTTWVDLPGVSTEYASVLEGHNIGGGAFPNPSTSPTIDFTFDPLPPGIGGIRLFGEGGGNAGADSGGFLGVFEFEVITAIPEPSSILLSTGLVVAFLGCVLRRRQQA